MLANQLLYFNPAKFGEVATLFFYMTLRKLFVKCNSALPFIVAVELLLLGKNVLKPKQSELRREHFEMLVF